MNKKFIGVNIALGIIFTAILTTAIFALRSLRPPLESSVKNLSRLKGNPSASISIVEYSDFECPACRQAQTVLNETIQKYPDEVNVIFQHFPLQSHRWSLLAHQAAECSAQQNAFWSFHDRLYNDQAVWSVASIAPWETFLRYAKEQKISLDAFVRCLENPLTIRTLKEERATGTSLGVRSTPSFFVNGKLVVGHLGLAAEIDALIAQNRKSES